MNNCLVTKYEGITSNSSYKKVGEMVIHQSALSSTTAINQCITFNNTKDCTVRIEGDGYITDESLTNNLGKTITIPANTLKSVYISNKDCNIYISEKYTLTSIIYGISTDGRYQRGNENKVYDLGELKYTDNIVQVATFGVKGDISDLKGTSSISFLLLSDIVYGDISAIKDNVGMKYLFIPNNVTGDISALSNMTKLISFYAIQGKVTGDISSLAGCTSLRSCILSNYITGDISTLKNNVYLTNINVLNSSLTGDLAVMPDNFYHIEMSYYCTFTWSERKSTAKIISILDSPKMTNIDKMLQDQANCVASSDSSKIISATGTRTSASDAAVATLQSKGYTVLITPA